MFWFGKAPVWNGSVPRELLHIHKQNRIYFFGSVEVSLFWKSTGISPLAMPFFFMVAFFHHYTFRNKLLPWTLALVLHSPGQAAPAALPWGGAQRTTCTSNNLEWIPTAPLTALMDLLILEDRKSTRYACYTSGCKTFLERITGRSLDWGGTKTWTMRWISPGNQNSLPDSELMVGAWGDKHGAACQYSQAPAICHLQCQRWHLCV